MGLLRASEVARSIFDVDYARLWAEGKRAVIFDLDNTLGERRTSTLRPEVRALLENLSARGFSIGVLTNRRWRSVEELTAQLGPAIPVVRMAHKPSRKGYATLLGRLGVSAAEAVMIGDRTLTDVVGANRCRIHSIRVSGFSA
ncbi:MAG: HAD-IIIA family hydrolase [Candidatus Bipolaricaulis sp.]|nr:HAD-IIIA family hydrolase [Candidatus Bipolaricaulis sp.]MDD5220040.1 HAD-IIIA family hydrolase [Candidatus Bipolaricaulis sp.]MDD5646505.1 HAD-IIIA family hydrolase [Candidatus Bipolaricaulis sp.]